jgi:hypothetical protein
MRLALLLLALASAVFAGPVRADQVWAASADGVLAQMRGGFALPDGLMVSFGIVRTVQIDGQIVSQTALQIPDLRSITVDQARQLERQAPGLAFVQNGVGNSAQLPSAVLPGLVIQNTENNRHLQAITEITATANSLRMLQGINLHQALSDALKGALGR